MRCKQALAVLAVAIPASGCGGDRGAEDGGPDSGLALDLSAPLFGGAISASPLPSAIHLEWEAAVDDITPASEIVYAIYEADRAGAQDFGQPSRTTSPGATSVVLGGLPAASTFFYVVRARDGAGNEDDNTVEVSATTPEFGDEMPPSFAGVEAAVPVGSSSMSLSWQPASDDVTPPEDIVYRVYLADASGAQDFSAPRLVAPPGATEVLVSELAADTTYFVMVRAVDGAGNEDDNTVEVSATTAASTSFAGQVLPILVSQCASAGCHGGRMPAEGLSLEADSAYGALVGVAASQCAERSLVAPGMPEASYLVNKLTGVDMCSGTRMPKSEPLSPAELQLVSDWIAGGANDDRGAVSSDPG